MGNRSNFSTIFFVYEMRLVKIKMVNNLIRKMGTFSELF